MVLSKKEWKILYTYEDTCYRPVEWQCGGWTEYLLSICVDIESIAKRAEATKGKQWFEYQAPWEHMWLPSPFPRKAILIHLCSSQSGWLNVALP
jgi:hypothetical protein